MTTPDGSATPAASRTAVGVAYLRAAHQLLDAAPPILDDPVALRLFDAARIRSDAERLRAPNALALRAHVVARSRYAEDRLHAAVARGVSQYIVLGAGYDTFAYRQPEWARALRIIEIDHAASQDAKRARLGVAHIDVPPNVTLAPIDLATTPLLDGLTAHGIALNVPTFVSWLGVTMYLEERDVQAVFRAVAGFPVGSEIVFTFAPTSQRDSALAIAAAQAGEPWRSYFTPDALTTMLRALGYASVEFTTGEEYFAERTDLPAPRRTTIGAATRA